MSYLIQPSLIELQQRKVFLKSLRPKMWENKGKLHRLNNLIDRVDWEILKLKVRNGSVQLEVGLND